MLHTKFEGNQLSGSENEDFTILYWAWQISFPLCLDAAYEIKLKLAH